MFRFLPLFVPALLSTVFLDCARQMPAIALSRVDPTFIQRCSEGPGVLVIFDARQDEYWGNGYDQTQWRLVGEERGNSASAPTKRMAVRRRLFKVLSAEGATRASTFGVVHYRESAPPVEVNVWMQDGNPRKVRVDHLGIAPLADWPCDLGFPRRSTFRIATLEPGDIAEIITPISGPEHQFWTFGSDEFCVLRSRATFGHPDDENRLDMAAVVVDASGGVTATSAAGVYPPEFEIQKPLLPISGARLPFVLRAPRCPGWANLRGRIFHTALWQARAGTVAGRELVNPFLVTPVKDGQRFQRIFAVANWLTQYVTVEEQESLFWMQWLPREPAHAVARKRRAAPSSIAALTYRILEEAGLEPRFALLHTNPRNPFRPELPTSLQFDTLAVLVNDDANRTIWLVPGRPFDPEQQPPKELVGRQALVMERWYADRQQGAGKCDPELELVLSCQISTPEPVEVKLVTVGE